MSGGADLKLLSLSQARSPSEVNEVCVCVILWVLGAFRQFQPASSEKTLTGSKELKNRKWFVSMKAQQPSPVSSVGCSQFCVPACRQAPNTHGGLRGQLGGQSQTQDAHTDVFFCSNNRLSVPGQEAQPPPQEVSDIRSTEVGVHRKTAPPGAAQQGGGSQGRSRPRSSDDCHPDDQPTQTCRSTAPGASVPGGRSVSSGLTPRVSPPLVGSARHLLVEAVQHVHVNRSNTADRVKHVRSIHEGRICGSAHQS